ncbi:MAG: YIP1 family protein [Acidobacteria bacterium]|nr:YIP1 family protein [Acidobacteriota bacterium]
MSDTTSSLPEPTPTPEDPNYPGLMASVIGVITSPGETFKHVARTPKVSGALFIVCLATALAQGLPQFTESGRAAALDMQVEQMETFGMTVTDEVYAEMEARSKTNVSGYITLVTTFLLVPFVSVIFTAIFWAIFNAILGGTASFKHVMAVVVHSQVVTTLSLLVAAPIMYARGQMSAGGIANLGALVPLDEGTFLAHFFGLIDLFIVWWVVVLAIGLATLYRRSTTGVATGLFITYAVIAVSFAYFLAG